MEKLPNSEVRNKILQAAQELFLAQGVSHVSMRKIATCIGYSPTTIYLYFENKRDLLSALIQDYYSDFIMQAEEVMQAQDVCPKASLRAYMMLFVHNGLSKPDYYKLMVQLFEAGESYDNSGSHGQQVYSHLKILVERCIAAKLVCVPNPNIAVQAIWTVVFGLTTLLTIRSGFIWKEHEVLVNHTIDTFLNGLFINTNKEQ